MLTGVDKDNGLNKRFCWPTRDRARAESPSKAPRTSSVHTASVLFHSHSSVVGTRCCSSPGVWAPLSRAATGLVWPGVNEASALVCCRWCKIGLTGQSRPLRTRASRVRRHLKVPKVAGVDSSTCRKGGVALGLKARDAAPARSGVAAEQVLADPDWRVIGGQDAVDPFWLF